ncbi:hypothetical protein DYQ48_05735 [Xanthomonas hortorum]|nr:hypothetical protein DYQ48_05735 [Xanthomonas hortorum]
MTIDTETLYLAANRRGIMAENEILDLGHRSHWKVVRALLGDPTVPMPEVVKKAGEDFEGMLSKLIRALRSGEPLLHLLRAAKQSPIAQQAVIAGFTEKRLAKIVLNASLTAQGRSVAIVAEHATQSLMQVMVDQMCNRALRNGRFVSHNEQNALRSSLANEFAQHRSAVRAALEASMTGMKVTPMKVRPKASAHDIAYTSLVMMPPGDSHAPSP